jgi:hypothetical protein
MHCENFADFILAIFKNGERKLVDAHAQFGMMITMLFSIIMRLLSLHFSMKY